MGGYRDAGIRERPGRVEADVCERSRLAEARGQDITNAVTHAEVELPHTSVGPIKGRAEERELRFGGMPHAGYQQLSQTRALAQSNKILALDQPQAAQVQRLDHVQATGKAFDALPVNAEAPLAVQGANMRATRGQCSDSSRRYKLTVSDRGPL